MAAHTNVVQKFISIWSSRVTQSVELKQFGENSQNENKNVSSSRQPVDKIVGDVNNVMDHTNDVPDAEIIGMEQIPDSQNSQNEHETIAELWWRTRNGKNENNSIQFNS